MERACRDLGVAPGASEGEIKSAYRKLVLQCHPDRHLSSSPSEQAAAAQRFKVVTEAYNFLTNPNERARSSYGASSSSAGGGRGGGRAYHNVNTDWGHTHYQGGGSGYTSTISRWEWWKRAARHGMRGFSHQLHLGLAVLLLGGGLACEAAVTAMWTGQNKGKSFEEVQAAVRARQRGHQQQQDGSGGGGSPEGGSADDAAQQQPKPVYHLRSSWADSMRGRLVPADTGGGVDIPPTAGQAGRRGGA